MEETSSNSTINKSVGMTAVIPAMQLPQRHRAVDCEVDPAHFSTESSMILQAPRLRAKGEPKDLSLRSDRSLVGRHGGGTARAEDAACLDRPLTVRDAAHFLGVSIQAVYLWVERKQIPHLRVMGRNIRVS
jgi:excisionase family DNA binding protein